jgi:lysophospholipase L1-like esterase
MFSKLVFLICSFLLGIQVFPQSPKKIISVIGSSTAFGTGASPRDSSWVNLTKKYFKSLGEIDTIYNLAVGGTQSFSGMPTGYTPPNGRPSPDPVHNVTAALAFNPDVVLINFPSNDVAAGVTLKQYMFNLHTMYDAVISAGKQCFVTTTQPRNDLSNTQQLLQKQIRDSVVQEFSAFSLNFYNPIVASDSLTINPIYNVDGIHVNNGGHQLLFQVVKAANILSVPDPLPLHLINFNAIAGTQQVSLNWTITGESMPVTFSIERSADGTVFNEIWQFPEIGNNLTQSFSWVDKAPLTTRSFYRLRITEQTATVYYSAVTSISASVKSLSIGKIYRSSASAWEVEIMTPKDQGLLAAVVDASGKTMFHTAVSAQAPFTLLSLDLRRLPAGIYFLRITSNQGGSDTKAFQVF